MLINLRNALMAGKRLPYDAEVEYLESTGTQYVNTGVVMTDNHGCDITFSFTSKSSAYTTPCSVRTRDGSDDSFTIYAATSDNANFAYGAKYWDPTSAPPPTIVPVNTIHRCTLRKGYASIDDVSYGIPGTITPSSLTLYLFGRNANGTFANGFVGKICACKIYEGSTLVRDYIPVRKGTVGYLYDRVSGKLFGNAGTGDFVLGQDVVPVEYIESHGTEWIDTGFNIASSDDARFVTTCTITNTVTSYSSTWVGSGVLSTGGLHYVLDQYGIRTGGGTVTNAIPYNRGDIVTIDVYYDSQHRRTCKIGQSIYQGTVYSASTAKLAILNYPAPTDVTSYPRQAGKLFHVEVYKSSALVRKFLPVRVGTDATSWEGAMMDTLTRRIYRNAGTGAFTYGNDLKYPIPAS